LIAYDTYSREKVVTQYLLFLFNIFWSVCIALKGSSHRYPCNNSNDDCRDTNQDPWLWI